MYNIDFSKKKVIIFLHGIQETDNEETLQHSKVLHDNFSKFVSDQVDDYLIIHPVLYESINDESLTEYGKQGIINYLISKTDIADYAVDVINFVSFNKYHKMIDKKIQETILHYAEQQYPVYIVGHSLGSMYGLHVINKLIEQHKDCYELESVHWPVQGCITLGSPITNKEFFNTIEFIPFNGVDVIEWINVFYENDIVTDLPFFDEVNLEEEIGKIDGWKYTQHVLQSDEGLIDSHTHYLNDPTVYHLLKIGLFG
jgi:hypothetical protein